MNRAAPVIAAVALAAGCRGGPREAAAEAGEPRAAPGDDGLCFTRGAPALADGLRRVDEPTVRAVAPATAGDAAALRFVYRGPTEQVRKLASGQVRRQLGLKLRAADGCNLVYVMWRIEPRPGIEVSVKHNPGKRTHGECGARGYTKVAPARAVDVPALAPGDAHTLEAAITGDDLVAKVDGRVVWKGSLGASARDLAGPAGLRTDNVVADVALVAAPAEAPHAGAPGCPIPGDE